MKSINIPFILFVVASCITLLALSPCHAQCLGVVPGSASGLGGPGREMSSFPDPYSKILMREGRIIERAFDLQDVRLSWVMEMNALSHPDHGVMMGEPLARHFIILSQQRENSEIYGVGFGFVLAHEYAHQFQFKHLNVGANGYATNAVKIELQADLLGAYWIGVRCRKQAEELRLNRLSREVAERMWSDAISESSFMVGEGWLAPRTHGTKAQRVSISSRAFQAGLKGKFGDDLSRFKRDQDGHKWMEKEIKDAMGED